MPRLDRGGGRAAGEWAGGAELSPERLREMLERYGRQPAVRGAADADRGRTPGPLPASLHELLREPRWRGCRRRPAGVLRAAAVIGRPATMSAGGPHRRRSRTRGRGAAAGGAGAEGGRGPGRPGRLPAPRLRGGRATPSCCPASAPRCTGRRRRRWRARRTAHPAVAGEIARHWQVGGRPASARWTRVGRGRAVVRAHACVRRRVRELQPGPGDPGPRVRPTSTASTSPRRAAESDEPDRRGRERRCALLDGGDQGDHRRPAPGVAAGAAGWGAPDRGGRRGLRARLPRGDGAAARRRRRRPWLRVCTPGYALLAAGWSWLDEAEEAAEHALAVSRQVCARREEGTGPQRARGASRPRGATRTAGSPSCARRWTSRGRCRARTRWRRPT